MKLESLNPQHELRATKRLWEVPHAIVYRWIVRQKFLVSKKGPVPYDEQVAVWRTTMWTQKEQWLQK